MHLLLYLFTNLSFTLYSDDKDPNTCKVSWAQFNKVCIFLPFIFINILTFWIFLLVSLFLVRTGKMPDEHLLDTVE